MINLTINQIVSIVEWSGRQEMFRLVLMTIGAAVALTASAFAAYGIVKMYRNLRRSGLSVLSAIFFSAYVLVVAYAGNDANKPDQAPSANLVFDTSLYNNGSVATNDYPSIKWTYDPWIANDVLHIDARPKESTNDSEWVTYYTGRPYDMLWTGYMPGCTGMTIYVWSEYVQPSPVSTNGVYHLDYLSSPLDYDPASGDMRSWILLRTPIYDSSENRLMSPPELPNPPLMPMSLMIDIPQEQIDDFINQ